MFGHDFEVSGIFIAASVQISCLVFTKVLNNFIFFVGVGLYWAELLSKLSSTKAYLVFKTEWVN